MKSQYYNPKYRETIQGLKEELEQLRTKYESTSTIAYDHEVEWPYEK